MDIVYSFISSKTVILAEYIQSPGAYIKNSFASLRKLYTNATREFTFKLDGYVYAYSFKDGFTYCVVAVDSVRKHVTMAYLGRVMEEFANRYGKVDEVTVAAYSLSEEFMPILKEQMQYLVDHPEENDIGNEANAIYIANVTNVGDKGEMRKNFGEGLVGIFYTFLAQDNNIVAENELNHDTKEMAHQFLKLLPLAPNKTYILTYGDYVFSFLVADEMTYGVVSKEPVQEALVLALHYKMLADSEEMPSSSDLISTLDHNLELCNSNPDNFMSKLKLKKEDFPAVKLESMARTLKTKVVGLKHNLLAKDEGRLKEIESARNKLLNIGNSWKLMKDYMETNSFHLTAAIEELNTVYAEIKARVDSERQAQDNANLGKVPYRYWKEDEVKYMQSLLQKEFDKMIPGEKSKLGRGKKSEDGEGCNVEIAKTFMLKFGEPTMEQCLNYITNEKKKHKQRIDAEAKAAKEKAAAAKNKACSSSDPKN